MMRLKCLVCAVALVLGTSLAQAGLSDIEAAVMDKNYEQVRFLSSQLLKQDSDSRHRADAQYYLGLSQLRMGKYADARKSFQAVMKSTANQELYDKAALGLVEALYMPGFYKDALKEGESLLTKSPNSQSKSLIYLKIARANLKLTQWQKARDYLQKILKEFPDSFEASIAKGLLEEREYFAVQVGSFLDKDKAIKLVDELKAKGQYCYVVETVSAGKTHYRVRVGQTTSLGDAQELESKLTQLGYPTLIYP